VGHEVRLARVRAILRRQALLKAAPFEFFAAFADDGNRIGRTAPDSAPGYGQLVEDAVQVGRGRFVAWSLRAEVSQSMLRILGSAYGSCK
jgi:hypothetical protein